MSSAPESSPGDRIRWEHWGGAGHFWLEVQLTQGTIAVKQEGGVPRRLDAEDLTRLRELARTVRPEHAMLQPSHLTYAQDESLEIVLDGARCFIDASSGEIAEGPPKALLDLMMEIARTPSGA